MLALCWACLVGAQLYPSWLDEYVQFHRQTRGKPDARYLVYHCKGMCGGIADRLKGIVTTFYAAIITKRVFIVHMPEPTPLSSILMPALIDWRWIDDKAAPACTCTNFDMERVPKWLRNISDSFDPWYTNSTACVRMNLFGAVINPLLKRSRLYAPFLKFPVGVFVGTAFRTAFQPTPALWGHIYEIMRNASLPLPDRLCYMCRSSVPWIAGHTRTGDRNFNRPVQSYDGRLMGTLLSCLNATLGSFPKQRRAFGYIASDSSTAKNHIHSLLPQMAVANIPILHFDKSRGDHLWAWAEFFVIGHAHCVIIAKYSGYSLIAANLVETFNDTEKRCMVDASLAKPQCSLISSQ
jgi:hypothetical protein